MEKDFHNTNLTRIALIGQPNVGKSTLFNRLVGKKLAIESNEAGTTRDWKEAIVKTKVGQYILMDTAGLEKAKDQLEKNVQDLLAKSLEKADLVIWVVDGTFGVSHEDTAWQRKIRSLNKPIWLVVNKCDNQSRREQAEEFVRLGINEIFYLSALHNRGLLPLEKRIITWLQGQEDKEGKDDQDQELALKFTLVGRPNVGKSSLLNAILSQDRTVVSDTPGTTRDTIDINLVASEINWQRASNVNLSFSDTAGIRRKNQIGKGAEASSVDQAIKSISLADIVLLVIDVKEGITKQDLHIAGLAIDEGKSILIVCNKWDLITKDLDDEEVRDEFIKKLQYRAGFLRFAPVIFTSTKDNYNIRELRDLLQDLWLTRLKEIPQEELDEFILDRHWPVLQFISKIEQIAVNPPRFKIGNMRPFRIYEIRQLKNALREKFEYFATPIEIELKPEE